MVDGNLKEDKKDTVRINLTISRDLYNIFKELSAVTGKSMAYMPAYVLEESTPTFQALIKAYTAAKTSKKAAMDIMKDTAERRMIEVAREISHKEKY